MPHTSDLASNFDFTQMISNWATYNSSRDKTNLSPNVYVRGSQNMYKKLSGNISVREGQKRLGVANPIASSAPSEFVWNTSWGATYILLIADTKLCVVVDEVWYILQSSLTKTRYVFDKWWDNTLKKDKALFVNGTSSMFSWGGGFGFIASTTSNTIVLDRTIVASVLPAASGSVVINGTTYTYSGSGGSTLTGVSPDPTGNANGSGVLEAVTTSASTPASGFLADFIKVINNQVYVGSYVSRLCYISANDDFTNYVVPTPRVAGDPELLTLDGTLKGIGVRQGNAYIGFGTSSWAVITFNDITVGTDLTQQTKVDVKPVALEQAPYAHEFIDNVGDNIVYLGQDQQVRAFGDFNNLFVSGYPSLSQELATELSAENFTGGALRAIGEFIYVTAPDSGKVYLRQERTTVDYNGNVVSEKLWHSPFIWNATRIDSIDGTEVAFSNANPQIYEIWDTGQWHDDSPSNENLPYACILALGYRNNGRRQGLLSFDKLYTEGYLTPGTPLNILINYDYLGSTNMISGIINSVDQPATLFTTVPPSMGDSSLGDNPLGDVTTPSGDLDALAKFRCINSLPLINCFEYQLIFSSDTADAQWEIEASAANESLSGQDATFIINKRRSS